MNLNLLVSLGAAIALITPPSALAAETGPCEARDLGFAQPAAGWVHRPLSKTKRDTVYTVSKEGDVAVLRAEAKASASAYLAPFKTPIAVPTSLSWRWKTDALVKGADNRVKDKEDAPLRVMLAFDGDVASLPDDEQTRFKRAKRLFGKELPYALLMYVWSDQVAPGTVIPSAHSSQVKMIAVASGSAGLGSWQSQKRNIAEDYKRAWGAVPGKLLGVAVMTDTDNTGQAASGYYADIRLECAG
ncbi:DUF3047 domain-containing protein [Niveibacterium sp. 24ML]|uniref:DUF3047 domain-containing protein n=1 Tax=Niveibacterium sp. 24ML TaxID=2985512 RepID=UPI00226EBF96|nr:DUF3047 domain-containing protein [Niveibacterium sp. 24ML]MCX9155651.1 DUF3047 domain-containing protein [Niveibacterium sp. 24ML]